jgi:hypothetical protein
MLDDLEHKVAAAEGQHAEAARRTLPPPPEGHRALPPHASLSDHEAIAVDAALKAQVTHLALQLEASQQRSLLLERRLHERQRWISPRDVLDLWEELERDVERLGIDHIGSSIQECKLKESEVKAPDSFPSCET